MVRFRFSWIYLCRDGSRFIVQVGLPLRFMYRFLCCAIGNSFRRGRFRIGKLRGWSIGGRITEITGWSCILVRMD